MVILTSFQKSKGFGGDKFSVARFQPKGFKYPDLLFLAAQDKRGQKMALDNYIEPVAGFAKALHEAYMSRWNDIEPWLNSLTENKDIVLCCWCPYSDSSKEEVKLFGTFACHSGLIGQLINKHRPDITVMLDADRQRRLIEQWKPKAYITEEIE